MIDSDWFDTKMAAEKAGKAPKTIRRWIDPGLEIINENGEKVRITLTATRTGRDYKIQPEAFDDFLRQYTYGTY